MISLKAFLKDEVIDNHKCIVSEKDTSLLPQMRMFLTTKIYILDI